MRKQRWLATVLQLIVLAVSCRQGPASTPPPQKAPDPREVQERGNLLNIALGASAVSRTAELTLDHSALRAIDGDADTAWTSPPGDTLQSAVFSFPATVRIDRIGARVQNARQLDTRGVRFETSMDGANFTPLASLQLKPINDVQLFPVSPTDARYVQVTATEVPGSFSSFRSIQASGTYLQRPTAAPIEGCWSVNGLTAEFRSSGGAVAGTITGSGEPLVLQGGVEGPVYRFAWTKRGFWGFALITAAPDGRNLSGIQWYQEPIAYDYGTSWFGERGTCAPGAGGAPPAEAVVGRFLDRLHRFPLYGLHFDATGRLSEAESVTALELLANLSAQHSSQRLRLVSAEYRHASPAENRRSAQARLDSLRAVLQKRGVDPATFEFVAAGSDHSPQPIENGAMRVLYSVVNVEAPIVEGR